MQTVILFIALGAFVGFTAGLFGVGGGGIMVPAFTTIFLMHGVSNEQVMHLALGTSMMSIVATSFSSFRAHHAKEGVRWDIFRKMLFGVVLGTFSATFLASYLSSFYLAIFFTVFMSIVAIRMALDIKPKQDTKEPSTISLFSAGTIIGAISAMMSVGGGAYTVPYLAAHNIDIKKAIGTSAAIGFPIALAGTFGFMINGWNETSLSSWQIGYVYLPAVIIVSFVSAFTAPLGVKVAHTLQSTTLKRLFAFLLVGLSVKMLFSVL
jgi:uncharacterized membrane protein YfcA